MVKVAISLTVILSFIANLQQIVRPIGLTWTCFHFIIWPICLYIKWRHVIYM